jgi:hypothetical protein
MPYKDPEVRKAKHKEYSKKHYEENKARVIATSLENKKRARVEWQKYKATLACQNCGQNHPATLDFHHTVRDKSNRKINELTKIGSYHIARQEIEKCAVLCANCHRIHHYNEKKVAKRKK